MRKPKGVKIDNGLVDEESTPYIAYNGHAPWRNYHSWAVVRLPYLVNILLEVKQ